MKIIIIIIIIALYVAIGSGYGISEGVFELDGNAISNRYDALLIPCH